MIPRPTLLERVLRARINLKIFKWYVGTGHMNHQDTDTDTDYSSDDDSDDCTLDTSSTD